MPTEYENLVTAMKALTQGEEPDTVTLPVAENDWNTRPDADSYGIITLDYETDALHGDNLKQAEANRWEPDAVYTMCNQHIEWTYAKTTI